MPYEPPTWFSGTRPDAILFTHTRPSPGLVFNVGLEAGAVLWENPNAVPATGIQRLYYLHE